MGLMTPSEIGNCFGEASPTIRTSDHCVAGDSLSVDHCHHVLGIAFARHLELLARPVDFG